MYKVVLHKNAVKFYEKADKPLRERLNAAIDQIAKTPNYHVHIKKLQGELSPMLRYRFGGIRIIYEIHEEIKTVRIKSIESRGSVYN